MKSNIEELLDNFLEQNWNELQEKLFEGINWPLLFDVLLEIELKNKNRFSKSIYVDVSRGFDYELKR